MDTVLDPPSGMRERPAHTGDVASDVGFHAVGVSAVSWGAIWAGAATAFAGSLILLALGSGLGFASISPWSTHNPSSTTVGVMTAIWSIITQWLAAALGGYMAGRLRTRAVGVHSDESYFRDTAHGLLAWAVATIMVVAIATSAGSALVGKATDAATTVAGAAAMGAANSAASRNASPQGYAIDTLFRSTSPDNARSDANDARGEAIRIFSRAIANGDMPAGDRAYLVQMIAARTGISQAAAEKRVDDAFASEKAVETKARDAANQARKTAAAFAMFTALSLVVGAFIACVAGALGGRLRDEPGRVS
jgi:hypothetical protein